MKKILILMTIFFTLSCSVEEMVIETPQLTQRDNFFVKYQYAYIGVLDIESGDGIWTGTMVEFKTTDLYKPGKTYIFQVWTGTWCDEVTGWCQDYVYVGDFIKTIQ